ncbi:MAG TPA: MFS transporter [Alphaproteobacteria bacterium]|nr:MFS transporter [Alphaproteobacteria bacterium]
MAATREGLALLGLGNAARALGSRNYRRYVIGNGVSLCGTWMQRIAVGWLTWQLTHSGAWLGVIAAADLIATVLLGPIAGALADRLERLRVARIVQLIAALRGVVLSVLVALDLVDIGTLFAFTLLQGLINAFDGPTRLALVPSLVGRAALSSALAINSIVFNLARFVGPVGAGFAIEHGGNAVVFALNAVSYLWFFAALMTIRLERVDPAASERGLFRSTAQGIAYAVRHPGLGPVLLLLLVSAVCMRGVVELLAGFADAVFGRGAEGLAWLTAMVGLGAMVGGIWMIRRGTEEGLPKLVIAHLLWSAVAMAGFAATNVFWLAALCLFASGFSMVVTGVGGQTLLQSSMDPAMRGRVMSLYGVIFRGGPALGTLLMGVLTGPLGFHWPVIGAGVLAVAYWAWARLDLTRLTQELESVPSGEE